MPKRSDVPVSPPKGNLFNMGFFKVSGDTPTTDDASATQSAEPSARKRAASAPSIVETKKKTMIMEAAKVASLSQQTRTSFFRDHGGSVDFPLECGTLSPGVKLSTEAAVLFLGEWVPNLATCDAVLRYGRGEKPKYFSVFSLLSLVAVLAGGTFDTSSSEGEADNELAETEDVMSKEIETPSAEVGEVELDMGDLIVVPFTADDLKMLRRYIGHEERIAGGTIEFTTHADAHTLLIDSLWEVKYKLSKLVDLFEAEKSEIWQFYKELISANNKNRENIKPGEPLPPVWGALSDDETWIFGKLTDPGAAGMVRIELSRPLIFHTGRKDGMVNCTADTLDVLNFIFGAMHGSAFTVSSGLNTIEHGQMVEMIRKVRELRGEAVKKTQESFTNATTGARATNMIRNMVKLYKASAGAGATVAGCAALAGASPNTLEYADIEKLFREPV